MRSLITFILLLVLFLPYNTFAQEASKSAEIVDVYAVFWPIVPGKTVADSMFWAKQLKEGISGFFSFGNINKSKYQIEIAEKRFVEASRLFENKDYSNALKSLDLNKTARDQALKLKKKAQEEKSDVFDLRNKLVKSLENQQKALKFLVTQLPEDQKSKIEEIIKGLTLQISEAN